MLGYSSVGISCCGFQNAPMKTAQTNVERWIYSSKHLWRWIHYSVNITPESDNQHSTDPYQSTFYGYNQCGACKLSSAQTNSYLYCGQWEAYITVCLRFFIVMEESSSLKLNELHLQSGDIYPQVVCNVA